MPTQNIVQLIIGDMIKNQNRMINSDDDREEQDMVADQIQHELSDIASEKVSYNALIQIRTVALNCGYNVKEIDFSLARMQLDFDNKTTTDKDSEIEMAYAERG